MSEHIRSGKICFIFQSPENKVSIQNLEYHIQELLLGNFVLKYIHSLVTNDAIAPLCKFHSIISWSYAFLTDPPFLLNKLMVIESTLLNGSNKGTKNGPFENDGTLVTCTV